MCLICLFFHKKQKKKKIAQGLFNQNVNSYAYKIAEGLFVLKLVPEPHPTSPDICFIMHFPSLLQKKKVKIDIDHVQQN